MTSIPRIAKKSLSLGESAVAKDHAGFNRGDMGGPWASFCCSVAAGPSRLGGGLLVFPSRSEIRPRERPLVVRHDWPVSRLPDSSARVRQDGKRRQGTLHVDLLFSCWEKAGL